MGSSTMVLTQMPPCLALVWVVACASARTAPGMLTEVSAYSARGEAGISSDCTELLERLKRTPSFHDLELERIARRRKANRRMGRRIGKVVIRKKNGRRVVVKKRRKPSRQSLGEFNQPVTVTKKDKQTHIDKILTQSEKFIPQSKKPQPRTSELPQPTASPPIPHIKHTLSPEENFPAIIVTPPSTQGIISSQEISKRNREKKIDTL